MIVNENNEKDPLSVLDDKKLPIPPSDAPPPYVYRASAGPSTIDPQTLVQDKPKSTFIEPDEDPALPIVPPPAPPNDSAFKTPATNYVSIVENHSSIKDAWTIDTTLIPPAWLLTTPSSSATPSFFSNWFSSGNSSTGEVEVNGKWVRPNLRLKSTHGKIDARVRVINGTRNSDFAVLSCQSTHGNVRLSVPFRGVQRLFIHASTTHAQIDVYIPRDFIGVVHHRTTHGSLNLSTAVTSNATTFAVQKGSGKTFIGDWRSVNSRNAAGSGNGTPQSPRASGSGSGFGTPTVSGHGSMSSPGASSSPEQGVNDLDTLVLSSTHGKMRVSYADEQFLLAGWTIPI